MLTSTDDLVTARDEGRKTVGQKTEGTPSRKVKQIWAIGGGKGGVGKSLISANLAIMAAQSGHKVVAVDLDLGCANLHTCLGVDIPSVTLSDFFSKRVTEIKDVLLPTGVRGLNLISGAQDSIGVANLKHTQKSKLLQKLHELDADYLVFDLGAGTAYNTLDFFLNADVGILVLLPEPTSIENTYRFIKSAYYRKLKVADSLFEIRPLIDMAMDQKNPLGIRSPADLLREASKFSPEIGTRLREEIHRFRPKLIINQTRTQSDVDIGFSIKSVCKKYFGIDMEYVGYLDYDSAVWQSVRRKRPVCLEFPNSKLASHFQRMTRHLLQENKQASAPIY
ncbi:MAG: P-loop NTPase [Deltaproteobacteria bacterium]|nr:P-loop NTPase [Deltaproteobacteria bacterium]